MVIRIASAVCLLLSTLSPAAALDGQTSLDGKSKQCRYEGDDGMLCKGLGGWKLALGFHTPSPSIAFIPPGHELAVVSEPADGRSVTRIDIGPPQSVTWRGSAAIISVQIALRDDYDRLVQGEGSLKIIPKLHILEIFRVGAEGACTIAYIDAFDPRADGLTTQAVADAAKTRCPVKSIATPGKAAESLKVYFGK